MTIRKVKNSWKSFIKHPQPCWLNCKFICDFFLNLLCLDINTLKHNLNLNTNLVLCIQLILWPFACTSHYLVIYRYLPTVSIPKIPECIFTPKITLFKSCNTVQSFLGSNFCGLCTKSYDIQIYISRNVNVLLESIN